LLIAHERNKGRERKREGEREREREASIFIDERKQKGKR
jgi:hypothetical protein